MAAVVDTIFQGGNYFGLCNGSGNIEFFVHHGQFSLSVESRVEQEDTGQ